MSDYVNESHIERLLAAEDTTLTVTLADGRVVEPEEPTHVRVDRPRVRRLDGKRGAEYVELSFRASVQGPIGDTFKLSEV
ncbi:MAG: hypothetical protein ABEI11_03315 [Haloarculaceae archaeon]